MRLLFRVATVATLQTTTSYASSHNLNHDPSDLRRRDSDLSDHSRLLKEDTSSSQADVVASVKDTKTTTPATKTKTSWCHGSQSEFKSCDTGESCPDAICIDCKWSNWSKWSPEDDCPCLGLQERHREIDTHNNECGMPCNGAKLETRSCGRPECLKKPVACELSEWGKWSECDRSCDGGVMKREREIKQMPEYNGATCSGSSDSDSGVQLVEIKSCNQEKCRPPIDCKFSSWSSWSQCSATCGGGQSVRRRTITQPPVYGGVSCTGELIEIKGCGNDPCTIKRDCVWDNWDQWSACSKTCNGGSRVRNRRVKIAPRGFGELCTPEVTQEIESCGMTSCNEAEDCKLSDWGDWSTCSSSCNGIRERDRVIIKYPDNGGKTCNDNGSDYKILKEVESCNVDNCGEWHPPTPIDCIMGEWGEFSSCSSSCGGGVKYRSRNIERQSQHGGKVCSGDLKEVQTCNEDVMCMKEVDVIECEISSWSKWSDCDKECGVGQKTRSRRVKKLPSATGGKCSADTGTIKDTSEDSTVTDIVEVSETQECYTGDSKECGSTDCLFGPWSDYGACTCTGIKERHRVIKQHAHNNGLPCSGPKIETASCKPDCIKPPIDCSFSEWEDWSSCSNSCGGGQRYRHRQINNIAENGGKTCEGHLRETEECNVEQCKQHSKDTDCLLSDWSNWSSCSAECGGGQHYRSREIKVHQSGKKGKSCEEVYNVDDSNGIHLKEMKGCNTEKCTTSQDCEWGEWSSFSSCSRTCGGGTKSRDRAILKSPKNGGKLCSGGVSSEVVSCNEEVCPDMVEQCTDGKWSEWEEWSLCSASCGEGFQYRSRSISQQPNHCGKALPPGPRDEYQACSIQACDKSPQDCILSDWTSFGDCSCKCNGIKERSRRIKQYSENGGKGCEGSLKEIHPCNSGKCIEDRPVDCELSEWTSWDECSSPCGGGMKTRSRLVHKYPMNGGKSCSVLAKEIDEKVSKGSDDSTTTTIINSGYDSYSSGEVSLKQLAPCNQELCGKPVDCVYDNWSAWSSCSKKCNGGSQSRYRHITTMPKFDGKPCDRKMVSQERACNTEACGDIEYCSWGAFSAWSKCSSTCGMGQQSRSRHLELHSGTPKKDDDGDYSNKTWYAKVIMGLYTSSNSILSNLSSLSLSIGSNSSGFSFMQLLSIFGLGVLFTGGIMMVSDRIINSGSNSPSSANDVDYSSVEMQNVINIPLNNQMGLE